MRNAVCATGNARLFDEVPAGTARSVYERAGEACYKCGTQVEMKRQGRQDRSTYFCPRCQPSRYSSSTMLTPR